MSRRKIDGKCSVRCGKSSPTPYLVKHYDQLVEGIVFGAPIVDMGCGNGRNSKYLIKKGFRCILPFDMVGDYGWPLALGKEKFPVKDGSVRIILSNYVLMFLNAEERAQVVDEIDRMAAPGCRLMVELYPAKDSKFPDAAELECVKRALVRHLIWYRDWEKLHEVKHKFIMEKI